LNLAGYAKKKTPAPHGKWSYGAGEGF